MNYFLSVLLYRRVEQEGIQRLSAELLSCYCRADAEQLQRDLQGSGDGEYYRECSICVSMFDHKMRRVYVPETEFKHRHDIGTGTRPSIKAC